MTVQLVSGDGNAATRQAIEQLAGGASPKVWQDLHGVEALTLNVAETDIATLAQYADVFAVEEHVKPVRNDEVQDQIIAANFNADQSGPAAPGYFTFLSNLGFSEVASDYPIVNVTDDGIGDGTTTNGAGDLTFTDHEDGTTSRIMAVFNCTGAAPPHGQDGHGHLNSGIVGGYDTRTGFPYVDNLGYLRGVGINPFVRLAHTKIFADGGSYNIANCGNTDAGVSHQEVVNGGVISTNSWGAPVGGAYNTDARAYDIAVRDADNRSAGQQPMIYVFSAGNSGPGGVVGGRAWHGEERDHGRRDREQASERRAGQLDRWLRHRADRRRQRDGHDQLLEPRPGAGRAREARGHRARHAHPGVGERLFGL